MTPLATLLRSLSRHRLFAALNIGGLALGIAVFLVLFLFVRFETTYDRGLPGWDRVWVVDRTLQFPGNPELRIPTAPTLPGDLRARYTGLETARMIELEVGVRSGPGSVVAAMAQVDPAFFRIFPYPALAGDAVRALADPSGAVVTERFARDRFGTAAALGRTLTATIKGEGRSYRVAAVLAPPPSNRSFAADLYVRLPEAGTEGRMLTNFVAVPDAAAGARLAREFPGFAATYPDPVFKGDALKMTRMTIAPLADRHLADATVRTVAGVLAAVGIVALLLAVVNYVNLATARAGLRAREIALRKVVGARREVLVAQLFGEAAVAVALAALVGLVLAELGLPFVNALGGTDLAIVYAGPGSILPAVGLLVVAVTLLAGFYPAIVLSRYRPAAVLAAAQAGGGERGGIRLRRALVVGQFAVAIALMIGTTVLIAQTRHLRSADLGFERGGLVMVPSYGDPAIDDAQRRDFAAAVAALPGVTATTTSAVAPAGGSFAIAPMQRPGARGEAPMIVQGQVGDRFFATYRARMLAGRDFDPRQFPADDGAAENGKPGLMAMLARSRTTNVVLNRTATRRLGFADPAAAAGQTLTLGDGTARVVGVVEDLRFSNPREPVEAIAYNYRSGGLLAPVLTVRTAGDADALPAAMETIWQRTAAATPFRAITVARKLYEEHYRQDVQRTRLFTLGAVLAAAIGCLGLYGLASFDTARRVREIGIRKVLGASTGDVLRLLLGQFLRPVLVANLVAWPVAWWAMRRWLAGFDDRIALSPLHFVVPALAALAIATATVAARAWRVSRAEPARALRYQ